MTNKTLQAFKIAKAFIVLMTVLVGLCIVREEIVCSGVLGWLPGGGGNIAIFYPR